MFMFNVNIEFGNSDLQSLFESNSGPLAKRFSVQVAMKFVQRVRQIEAANDERNLVAIRSLHFEALKGGRAGEFSVRLDRQFRLIFTMRKQAGAAKIVTVTRIEDYH